MDLEKGERKKKKFTSVKKLLLSCSNISATNKEVQLVTPGGCFAVYVGPEKQRFVVKTKYANHPLFKMLLEDAELEYGFKSEGPILLPCDVQLFYRVLGEMDCCRNEIIHQSRCGNFSPFTSTRHMGKGYSSSSYALLTPSSILKMNHS